MSDRHGRLTSFKAWLAYAGRWSPRTATEARCHAPVSAVRNRVSRRRSSLISLRVAGGGQRAPTQAVAHHLAEGAVEASVTIEQPKVLQCR